MLCLFWVGSGGWAVWVLAGGAAGHAPPAHASLHSARTQKKHVECAEALLGPGKELNSFVARLLDDIANLKAMLQAIAIGAWTA